MKLSTPTYHAHKQTQGYYTGKTKNSKTPDKQQISKNPHLYKNRERGNWPKDSEEELASINDLHTEHPHPPAPNVLKTSVRLNKIRRYWNKIRKLEGRICEDAPQDKDDL